MSVSVLHRRIVGFVNFQRSFRRDTEVAHSAIEMTAVDAHALGGFCDIAVIFGELVLDEFALVRIGRILE